VTNLEGCEYVDISETPLTNTLPIRRLGSSPAGCLCPAPSRRV